jgi:hypothetical protein
MKIQILRRCRGIFDGGFGYVRWGKNSHSFFVLAWEICVYK